MALIVAHINKDLTERERAARRLWEDVLAPKWDAKLRVEAEVFFLPGKMTDQRPPPERA